MPDDKIQASVGMHKNGTTNCYNLPEDVAKIVKLLNFISDSEGGTGSAKLPPSPSPRQLFLALRNFQQTQNDLGRTPRLSVDGHVDPGANTLARLNQIARRIQPIGPGDLFLPPLREAIPGFDTVASDGTIIELPREFVRPGGRVVEYTHPDAVVTVRIETAQDRNKDYMVVLDKPTNEHHKEPLRRVPQANRTGRHVEGEAGGQGYPLHGYQSVILFEEETAVSYLGAKP
jgi:hypothetical protein